MHLNNIFRRGSISEFVNDNFILIILKNSLINIFNIVESIIINIVLQNTFRNTEKKIKFHASESCSEIVLFVPRRNYKGVQNFVFKLHRSSPAFFKIFILMFNQDICPESLTSHGLCVWDDSRAHEGYKRCWDPRHDRRQQRRRRRPQ